MMGKFGPNSEQVARFMEAAPRLSFDDVGAIVAETRGPECREARDLVTRARQCRAHAPAISSASQKMVGEVLRGLPRATSTAERMTMNSFSFALKDAVDALAARPEVDDDTVALIVDPFATRLGFEWRSWGPSPVDAAAKGGKVRAYIGRSLRYAYFPAIKRLKDADLAALPEVLAGRNDPVSRFIVAAAPGAGVRPAVEYLAQADKFDGCAKLARGIAKIPAVDPLQAAALQASGDEATVAQFNAGDPEFPDKGFWAIVALAARADATVLDRLASRLTGGDSECLLAQLRAATDAYLQLVEAGKIPHGPRLAEPAAPQKASEVARWLAARPTPDVALLEPHRGQKAAAKVAAVRALGEIGGADALAVLARYAAGEYSDAMLKELHGAWGRFDRREFAAAMFRTDARVLDLGEATNLEGIEAVPNLTALKVVFDRNIDLSPLARCESLTSLVMLGGRARELDLSVVAEAPLLEELSISANLRGADLTPLARSKVKRLSISLDGGPSDVLLEMPKLEWVKVSGRGTHAEVDPGLIDVVLELARRRVKVVLWEHEREWVTPLREKARAEGLFI